MPWSAHFSKAFAGALVATMRNAKSPMKCFIWCRSLSRLVRPNDRGVAAAGGSGATLQMTARARLGPLERDQVFQRLALADDLKGRAVHENLRHARAVVVVAAHREAVRAGGEDGQQVAALDRRKVPGLGQVVAALADRPDDVHRLSVRD